jgi:hypothetical protein
VVRQLMHPLTMAYINTTHIPIVVLVFFVLSLVGGRLIRKYRNGRKPPPL